MYMYMHSSTDRVRQVNGAPTQQSHYTECLLHSDSSAVNIYKGREGRGELVIHSLYTEKRTLSLFLSVTHCKCTLFFVLVRMQWDFWFSFGGFILGEFAFSLSISLSI